MMSKYITRDRFLICLPYVIYGLLISFLVLTCEFFGDDVTFRAHYNWKFADWLSFLYYEWSSRVIVEMFLPVLCYHPGIWRILNVLISLLLYYSLQKLFCKTHLSRFVLLMCLLIFPYYDLSSAGWITTTLVYWWPLSLGVFSLLSIKKITDGEKLRRHEYVLYSAALLFASNNEVVAAMLLSLFAAYIIYLKIYGKISNSDSAFILSQMIICAANIFLAVIAPGNYVRQAAETARRWPAFAGLGFTDKMYMGFNTTMHHIIIRDNLIFLVFCVLLAIMVFARRKERLCRVTAVFPCFASAFLSVFLPGSPVYWHGSEYLNASITFHTVFYTSAFIVIGLCVVLSLFFSFGKDSAFLLLCFILGLGLASRVIMGFSPTLFVSDTRTFTFLWASILCGILLIYNKLEEMLAPDNNEIVMLILLIAVMFSSNTAAFVNKAWTMLA